MQPSIKTPFKGYVVHPLVTFANNSDGYVAEVRISDGAGQRARILLPEVFACEQSALRHAERVGQQWVVACLCDPGEARRRIFRSSNLRAKRTRTAGEGFGSR